MVGKGGVGNRIILYALLIFTTALLSFPYMWMFLTALRPESELYSSPPLLLPRALTLENFSVAILQAGLPTYMLNSFKVAGMSVTIVAIAAAFGGYAFSRFKYMFHDSILRFILFSYMIPPILSVIPLFLAMSKLRLINTLWGLSLVELTITFPICLWILIGFFSTIPIELEESASIEGANRLQVFFWISLPLAFPGIVAVSIFSFMASWSNYVYALIFLSSPEKKTLPLALALFIHAAAVDWGPLMAAGTLASIPTLLVFLVFQRQLIFGFGGAVKG